MHPKIQLERDEEELRRERQEDKDFFKYWLGTDNVKCQSCYRYVERGQGFPEGSENPTNCTEACRDLSFKQALVKPTRYFQGSKLYELIEGQLIEIVDKPEDYSI